MKSFLFIIIALLFASCSPYQAKYQPIKMNYSVSIFDHGTILCRDFKFNGDTLMLYDAGYYKSKVLQSNVSDIIVIGKNGYLIVPTDTIQTLKNKKF